MIPLVSLALDVRVKPVAGKYPVCIRVTFFVPKRVRLYYRHPKKYYLSKEEFEQIGKTRIEEVKRIRSDMSKLEQKAELIVEKYHVFTREKFELYFLSQHLPESLAGQFEIKVNELRLKNKISSTEKYETALKSFQGYFGKEVSFHDCNTDGLHLYEEEYVKKGSLTTVGINMRCLRHIFKRSIKAGIINESLYPFGDGEDQYCIPEGEGDGLKKFLDTDQKNLFIDYSFIIGVCEKCNRRIRGRVCKSCKSDLVQVPDDHYNTLHDYALFIYLAFGLNPADVFRLRKSQIKGDHIILKGREKTKSKKKKRIKTYTIPLHKTMLEIIWKHGVKSIGSDTYVFGVLSEEMNELDKFKAVRKIVHDINRMLKAMSKSLDWAITPTIYTLRHTFSNEFMQLGASTEELQDALMHGSKRTTEIYKHGFSLSRKKKLSEGL